MYLPVPKSGSVYIPEIAILQKNDAYSPGIAAPWDTGLVDLVLRRTASGAELVIGNDMVQASQLALPLPLRIGPTIEFGASPRDTSAEVNSSLPVPWGPIVIFPKSPA